jgi:hypothetical protein
VAYSIQFEREKSATEMNAPNIKTAVTTTNVELLSSAKLGQDALRNSESVSL